MLRVFAIALFVTMGCACAAAQQQGPSLNDRVAAILGSLTIQTINQSMQIEQLQSALKSAQDRVRELEAKSEQKPPDSTNR